MLYKHLGTYHTCRKTGAAWLSSEGLWERPDIVLSSKHLLLCNSPLLNCPPRHHSCWKLLRFQSWALAFLTLGYSGLIRYDPPFAHEAGGPCELTQSGRVEPCWQCAHIQQQENTLWFWMNNLICKHLALNHCLSLLFLGISFMLCASHILLWSPPALGCGGFHTFPSLGWFVGFVYCLFLLSFPLRSLKSEIYLMLPGLGERCRGQTEESSKF